MRRMARRGRGETEKERGTESGSESAVARADVRRRKVARVSASMLTVLKPIVEVDLFEPSNEAKREGD